MQIGILTWFFGANYGAKAHSYALQQVLKELGHDSEFIAFYPKGYKVLNYKMNLDENHREKSLIKTLNGVKRVQVFNSFNKHFAISKEVHNAQEIDSLGLDCIILGSDEVFNTKHPLFHELYYGVGIHTPLIAYAPSSGYIDVNEKLPGAVCDSLKMTKALLVRDYHTMNLIKNNTGQNAHVVLDPTLLYDFKDLQSTRPNSSYILVYTFSKWNEYGKKFREYAGHENLDIISVGRYCKWADKSYDMADLSQWLNLFKGAEFVITDSFHGVVFAIKNRKNVLLLGRADKTNKINDLFHLFDVEKKFYKGEAISQYFTDTVDCSGLWCLIESAKTLSLKYLKEALDSIEACKKHS